MLQKQHSALVSVDQISEISNTILKSFIHYYRKDLPRSFENTLWGGQEALTEADIFINRDGYNNPSQNRLTQAGTLKMSASVNID
jgi:hypothetical protein